ncbi:hypothetical protein DFH06DRAFT_1318618 [Mycena polygramma]|nr:hypothetical protein DFH06DRAFT_1318618 [Mycena polygramma]
MRGNAASPLQLSYFVDTFDPLRVVTPANLVQFHQNILDGAVTRDTLIACVCDHTQPEVPYAEVAREGWVLLRGTPSPIRPPAGPPLPPRSMCMGGICALGYDPTMAAEAEAVENQTKVSRIVTLETAR